MTLQIEQFPCRSDNFGVLIHDTASGKTASIDAPEEAAILAALQRTGWRLTHIFNTHHHIDHVEANEALKHRFDVEIIGPAGEADRIPGIDHPMRGGETMAFGNQTVTVIDTPGHTAGEISYYLEQASVAFTADCLFSLGCGRLFEGTAETMWESMKRLLALPDETVIYCGHEYTAANARFALSVDPGNKALQARAEEVSRLRADGKPTLPVTLALEKLTNPFLRPHDPEIRLHLDMLDASDAEVFGKLRALKDSF